MNTYKRIGLVLALVLMLGLVSSSLTAAQSYVYLPDISIQEEGPDIVVAAGVGKADRPLGEPTYGGKSYGEWSAKWWQWAESEDPLSDVGPVDCGSGQSGPVWFLAGTDYSVGDDPEVRNCIRPIPRGKALFFPLVNAAFYNGPGEDFSVDYKRDALDEVFSTLACNLSSKVDGKSTTVLPAATVRTQSNQFSYLGDPEAISDGYWIMLRLPAGEHTVHIEGALCGDDGPFFRVNVLYTLTVR